MVEPGWAGSLRSPYKASDKDKRLSPTVPKEPQFATAKRASVSSIASSDFDAMSREDDEPGSHQRKISGPLGRVPVRSRLADETGRKPSLPAEARGAKSRFRYESPVPSPVARGSEPSKYVWENSLRPTTQRASHVIRREVNDYGKSYKRMASPPQAAKPPSARMMATVPESVSPTAATAADSLAAEVESMLTETMTTPAEDTLLHDSGDSMTATSPTSQSKPISNRRLNPITHEPLPYSPTKQFGQGRGKLVAAASAATRAPFATTYNTPEDENQPQDACHIDAPEQPVEIDFSQMEAHSTMPGNETRSAEPSPRPSMHRKQKSKARFMSPTASSVAKSPRGLRPEEAAPNSRVTAHVSPPKTSEPAHVQDVVEESTAADVAVLNTETIALSNIQDEEVAVRNTEVEVEPELPAVSEQPAEWEEDTIPPTVEVAEELLAQTGRDGANEVEYVPVGEADEELHVQALQQYLPEDIVTEEPVTEESEAVTAEDIKIDDIIKTDVPEEDNEHFDQPELQDTYQYGMASVEPEELAPAVTMLNMQQEDYETSAENELVSVEPGGDSGHNEPVLASTDDAVVDEYAVNGQHDMEKPVGDEYVKAASQPVLMIDDEDSFAIDVEDGTLMPIFTKESEDNTAATDVVEELNISVDAQDADEGEVFQDAIEAGEDVSNKDEFVVVDHSDFVVPEDVNVIKETTAPAEEQPLPTEEHLPADVMATNALLPEQQYEEVGDALAAVNSAAEPVQEQVAVAREDAVAMPKAMPAAIEIEANAAASPAPSKGPGLLKDTPAGARLVSQAEIIAQMTIKQAVEQLAAGTTVHKAWVRDGKQKGSNRHVKAKVLNDLVLLTYSSGMVKKATTVVVIRCCLTIEQNKTTLLLETDNGTLALQPFTPQHETLWALGINAMLHLAENQDRLNQSTALKELSWHGIVN